MITDLLCLPQGAKQISELSFILTIGLRPHKHVCILTTQNLLKQNDGDIDGMVAYVQLLQTRKESQA